MGEEEKKTTVVDEVDGDGLMVCATVKVQCGECGDLVEGELVNGDPSANRFELEDHYLECKKCSGIFSAAAGHPVKVIIAVSVLVGAQVDLAAPDGRLPIYEEEPRTLAEPESHGERRGGWDERPR